MLSDCAIQNIRRFKELTEEQLDTLVEHAMIARCGDPGQRSVRPHPA